jgi:hypothetical protein
VLFGKIDFPTFPENEENPKIRQTKIEYISNKIAKTASKSDGK